MKIMKTAKTAFLASLLIASTSIATANSYPPTKTFEGIISSVRMPATPNGTITLRECDDCDFQTIRVTSNTRFEVNNKSVKFDDFRKLVLELKPEGEATVNVTRDEASQTVAVMFLYID